MNGNCAACGCAPCNCATPSFLNEPRFFDPVVSGGTFTGGTFDGPTINDGTSNGQQINDATIDCLTTVCTQPNGTCDATIASTAFVCDAISDAIDGGNPDFCNAVNACLGIVTDFCTQVGICINTTPNIIANPAAFDPATYATDAIYGVTRFASLGELQAANCELAIDPCTLGAFWSAGGPNALWTAFEAAVNNAIMGGGVFCANVFACGVQSTATLCADVLACGFQEQATLCADVAACGFAPLASPVFTGDPQAPTPAPGDNDTSIATTAFVQNEITTAISPFNPAFCATVLACGGGGGGGGAGGDLYASGAFDITEAAGLYSIMPIYATGLSIPAAAPAPLPFPYTVTIITPLASDDYTVALSFDNESAPGVASFPTPQLIQGVGTIDFEELPLPLPGQTLRVHMGVLAKATSIPCATLQASFTPAAAGPIPAGVRILADDCLSYAPIGQVVAFASGITWNSLAFGAATFVSGCITVGGAGLTVTFSTLQPDANYSVVLGGNVGHSTNSPGTLYAQVSAKTTAGFSINPTGVFNPGDAGDVLDFTVVR